MPDLLAPTFWIAVAQIIAIDVVLSGDNAVVIALACRNLPTDQRRRGILWGVVGAVGLRVALTTVTALVMNLPWLKLVGGALLLWIGIKLMLPEDEGSGPEIEASGHLWGAVRTIVVADFVMSLDNVIAVAGAAHGSLVLLLFGLAVSIPLIVWSSQWLLNLMERWPAVVLLGAGLLGFVAGEMLATDPATTAAWPEASAWMPRAAGIAGALLVVGVGRWIEQRRLARQDVEIV